MKHPAPMFRGLMFAMPISLAMWIGIIALVRWVVR